MLSSRITKKELPAKCLLRSLKPVGMVLALVALAGCTVEPLNASRPSSQIDGPTTQSLLASTTVNPVGTRVGQQVRNKLLFLMNGGQLQAGGQYHVTLKVTSSASGIAVENSSLSATSSQVTVSVTYEMIDSKTRKTITKGLRKGLAGYDRTPQNFANERAQRDAENRAAHEAAQQVRLALAQAISKL